MISILYNLISFPMLLVDFALDDLVLLLRTPAGLTMVFSSLIFAEYSTAKSIAKSPDKLNLKTIVNYIRNFKPRNVPLTTPQWAALDTIFINKNIGIKDISNNIGIKIGVTRKIISGLAIDGYITREVNTNDRRAFCYITSNKYDVYKRYNTL